MSTTVPLRERILENIVSELKTISTANGYRTNVKTVSRQVKDISELTEPEFPALFVISGGEVIEEATNRALMKKLSVGILAYVYDTSATDTKISNILADIQEKMYADKSRGGYAIDTILNSIETDEASLQPYGISLSIFTIEYWDQGTEDGVLI